MTSSEQVVCVQCGGATKQHERRPDLHLLRCQQCGLIFLPIENPSKYVERMETEFFSEGFATRQNAWQHLFDKWNARRTLRRLRQFKRRGRLLEIGVGSGIFLDQARQAGFECMGIDASKRIADQVQQVYKLPVFCGYLEEFCLSHGQPGFDVIVMNHVLEHMPNPSDALRRVDRLLAKGGILHIGVPNVSGWDAVLPGWTAYEPYHLFYFSPATLRRIVENVSMQVLKLETVEPFSGWFNAALRTIIGFGYSKVRASYERGEHSPMRYILLLNALNLGRVIFGLITFPLRWMQGKLKQGEELIVLASAIRVQAELEMRGTTFPSEPARDIEHRE